LNRFIRAARLAPQLFWKALRPSSTDSVVAQDPKSPFFQTAGHCPTCDNDVVFTASSHWFRDDFVCGHCASVPRERALMVVIDSFFPNWRNAVVHESSPGHRGASLRLSKECKQYIPSQFFSDQPPGAFVGDMRCEDLESLSFSDESIDLHITQDVLEHIFHPSRAFREIARTLKPGGMHICTVPIVNKHKPSSPRALIENGKVVHLQPEEYHGNPVGDGRSLVTVDWGYDICRHIFESSGLFTQTVHIDDMSKGIRAEYIEVLVTVKPQTSATTSLIP
jgi:hypothetical protein